MTEALSIPDNAITWNIDWKFALASGVAVFMIIMAVKTDTQKAGEVSLHVVDACRESAVAVSNTETGVTENVVDE